MKQIRVLIADDHIFVRKGIRMFLDTEPSVSVVGEAEDGNDAIRMAGNLRPDVVLMDLVMPGMDGIEAIAEIKGHMPDVKIIVLTTFGDDSRINAALKVGADGYLLKDADGDSLLQAIHAVRQGDMPLHPRVARRIVRGVTQDRTTSDIEVLTEREKDVLLLVARGLSNRAIAKSLDLSEGTVKVHVSNILDKLNVSSRTEAAVWAVQVGFASGGEGTGEK